MTYISIDKEPHISLVLSNANVPFIAKLGEVAVTRFVSRISHPRSSSTVVPPAGKWEKSGSVPNGPHAKSAKLSTPAGAGIRFHVRDECDPELGPLHMTVRPKIILAI